MGRYALIVTATGAVDNVIEYDGSAPFNPGAGMELREATNDAEPGGSWDGSVFIRRPAPVIPEKELRMVALMAAVQTGTKYDEDGNESDKTADEIAIEKAELLTLLKEELALGDMDNSRMQMMLRLERE